MSAALIEQLTEADPRFGARLSLEPSGCVVYTGARTAGGYGNPSRVVDGRKTWPGAHRLAWQLVGLPLLPGLVLDHVCKNRACCNPEHLRQVTQRFNVVVNSTSVAARNAAKTACPKGHSLDDAYVWRNQRRCRICNTEAARKYKARKKARAT